MAKGGNQNKSETVDEMLLDLGPGSLDQLSDESWVWGSGLGDITGSGGSPVEAIANAWAQLPQE